MSEATFSKTIKPFIGLVVIDPATSRALPPYGARVQGNAEYWLRRLNDGDVVEAEAAPAAPAVTEVTEQ